MNVTVNGELCPACGQRLIDWFTKRGVANDYPIKRCRRCRSAFVMPRLSDDEIAALYSQPEGTDAKCVDERYRRAIENEQRDPALTRDGERIAARLRALGAGNRVLDVGAGDGFHSRALLKNGFDVDALEPSAVARDVFYRINGRMPLDGFLDASFVASHENAYDVVLLSQVLEHLVDPELAVDHLRRLLRPGGIAAIAVPHFRSWLSRIVGRRDMFICPPVHLSFFTIAGLGSLMARHGFECAFYETVTWFDHERVSRRVPRPLGMPFVLGLKAFFAVADPARGGNTLEAYFHRND